MIIHSILELPHFYTNHFDSHTHTYETWQIDADPYVPWSKLGKIAHRIYVHRDNFRIAATRKKSTPKLLNIGQKQKEKHGEASLTRWRCHAIYVFAKLHGMMILKYHEVTYISG
jgi:hypothetical protein